MELAPKLIDVKVPRDPDGAVLVLHGGASRGTGVAVSPTQLSVLRMIPIARRIARAGHGRLAVFRLLNSQRGWDGDHTPVSDAQWALDAIAERLGDAVPTCLVGHSLGGRAAILAAGHPMVRGAVALAPYVYPTDIPRGSGHGKRLLIVHGTADRVADPARSQALAAALRPEWAVTYVSVEGGKHAMLSRHAQFSGPAAEFAADTLLGRGADDRTAARV
ncbi:hypothetical protein DSM112329_03580 [Paraconexibacter sp. AEG42_29]|uniref:Alpha/beta hydrolase fold-5 domain-containing protein n=1 Tax=Paraconexibacter sp. AEG42_29 TaxID=2997339 RepID=A0AAU7AYI4_9ACTN